VLAYERSGYEANNIALKSLVQVTIGIFPEIVHKLLAHFVANRCYTPIQETARRTEKGGDPHAFF
jgi:hypothetical protein